MLDWSIRTKYGVTPIEINGRETLFKSGIPECIYNSRDFYAFESSQRLERDTTQINLDLPDPGEEYRWFLLDGWYITYENELARRPCSATLRSEVSLLFANELVQTTLFNSVATPLDGQPPRLAKLEYLVTSDVPIDVQIRPLITLSFNDDQKDFRVHFRGRRRKEARR
jgi:hypothetical protein